MILVTGGQRSGKSKFATNYCENNSPNPLFIATCDPQDQELENRVNRHKSDRGNQWKTIEEPITISNINPQHNIVLIDCVTLWLTNIFFNQNESLEESLAFAKSEIDIISNWETNVVWVTNEIGLGIIPAEKLSRTFCDLQGWVNQYIAEKSSEVYFLVSGISMKIKP